MTFCGSLIFSQTSGHLVGLQTLTDLQNCVSDHFYPPRNATYTERHNDAVSKGALRHVSALIRKQHSCYHTGNTRVTLPSEKPASTCKTMLSPETFPTFLEADLHLQLPRMTQGTTRDSLGTRGTQGSE